MKQNTDRLLSLLDKNAVFGPEWFSPLAYNLSRRLCNQSSLCHVSPLCCWLMIASVLFDYWGSVWLLVFYIYINTYIQTRTYNWVLCFCWCDWLSEGKRPPCTRMKVAVWKTECRAGDLWPGGRLISAVTSPDVRLAVSPFPTHHIWSHTLTCNHTVHHTTTHTPRRGSVLQASADSPSRAVAC